MSTLHERLEPFFQPTISKIKTNRTRGSLAQVFPRFASASMYLLRMLVGWLLCDPVTEKSDQFQNLSIWHESNWEKQCCKVPPNNENLCFFSGKYHYKIDGFTAKISLVSFYCNEDFKRNREDCKIYPTILSAINIFMSISLTINGIFLLNRQEDFWNLLGICF